MVYGELGALPIECIIKSRILNFWCRIVNAKQDKICNMLYRLMYELNRQNVYHSPWIKYVKTALDELGFSEFWLNNLM